MKTTMMALAAGCMGALGAVELPLDMDVNVWEPKTPVLATAPTEGFRGRCVPLVRITAENAVGDESAKTLKVAGWRNERVNGQFVVWSAAGERQLRLESGDLVSENGRIPASAVRGRFVRYVRASLAYKGKTIVPEQFVGDCLDDVASTDTGWLDMPPNGFRPVWVTISVPKTAAPGLYRGTFAVRAAGGKRLAFPIELAVRAETLADPKDWAFFLDLWQHPWAVARYYHVKPFSDEHFRRLEPLLKELAAGGQKTITTTITDLPWNHQNFDAYRTMVEHVKNADGTWTHDYSVFDRWVAFARSCGLNRQIHCYTMASWGNIVYYVDGATGDRIAVELKAGTPEHEAFWAPFLRDFSKHLAAKGWLGSAYIALDERSREELMASVECIRKNAPQLKVAMAGNLPPSTFAGIEVHNYCSAMGKITPEYIAEIPARRAKGYTTTYYICCGPLQPNTFATSPLEESRWLGLFASAKDLDGMLRWAAFNWPRDPFADTTFPGHRGAGGWRPGDTFLLYPDARASVRWEAFRDSVENFEKIRALRAAGKATAELDASLKALVFDAKVTDKPASAWAAEADRVEAAIDAASARR